MFFTTYLSSKIQNPSYFKRALKACYTKLSFDCTGVFISEFNRVVISTTQDKLTSHQINVMVNMSFVLEQLLGHCLEERAGHVADVHFLVHHSFLNYERTPLL